MSNLFMNGTDYGTGNGASMAYVGQRTLFDKSGNPIHKIYMKIADWDGIGESIIEIEEEPTAGFHNSIFRGRNITSYYEDGSLYTRITSGNFDDLYVGDYFKAIINGQEITCRIAGFDIYMNHRESEEVLDNHHVVIVPDEALTAAKMNETNIVTDGFMGSKMYTTTLPFINGYLQTTFGEHLVLYRDWVSSYTDGLRNSMQPTLIGSAATWQAVNATSILLSEVEVFGAKIASSSGYDIGKGTTQLPLFRINPKMINPGKFDWWLRAVASSTGFVYVSGNGYAYFGDASYSRGVRPRWIIG